MSRFSLEEWEEIPEDVLEDLMDISMDAQAIDFEEGGDSDSEDGKTVSTNICSLSDTYSPNSTRNRSKIPFNADDINYILDSDDSIANPI